jgi:4-hydroxy-tetrahydrodipicolinate synthase
MKTIKRIEGIITPIVTPLQEDASLDPKGLKNLIESLIEGGVSGIFIMGTTGGGPALSPQTQRELIWESVKIIDGRCPLLCGISSASMASSIELGLFAKSAGVDAVVAAPPCYLPPDEEELESFFITLAEKVDMPLYIYNMPAMTKIDMSPELTAKLSKVPGIVGYKDSSGNMESFRKVLELLKDRDDFAILMGPETKMCEAVMLGAHGGVNSGSNVAPQLFVDAYNAAKNNDEEEVKRLQEKIVKLQKIYTFRNNICCGVITGIKAALHAKGICGISQTPPYRPADQELVDTISQIIKAYI